MTCNPRRARQRHERLKPAVMPDDPRILELVEEIMESGRAPEDVCAQYPDLVWEVRECLRRLRRVDAQLDELFPSTPARESEHAGRRDRNGELPQISGYEVE